MTGPKKVRDDLVDEHDLDSTIVSANESSAGGIAFDDLGQPRWKFPTEDGAASEAERTFDLLKALDNDSIELLETKAASETPAPSKQGGYNPYDTGRDDSPAKPRVKPKHR